MSDAISRLNAALEGRYRIERQLGEGGMATVYLADDLRHERKVALKVLKPELAAVVGAERFLAEIKTTANLQHPHILPLFDSGEADKFLFYVMPYVEGESLRERLDREHQLPVDEAVRIATNVAEALDYAHAHGVVHRDIKPANILSQAGKPVISDFGIALAVGAAGGGRLTETGLSLGTPHYMSPEQATGDQAVGVATDIYALGCVLYEMLVGDPPYVGSTAQAILGKIVTGDADSVRKHRRSVPPNVDAAVSKALEKLPADRFTSARELSEALADRGFRHREGDLAPALSGRQAAWRAAALVGSGALVGLGAAAVWAGLRPGSAPPDVMRFAISTPASAPLDTRGSLQDVAISPDGTQIAYVSLTPDGDAPQINLRPIDQLAGAPLRGAESGMGPFFSPDGEWLGFIEYRDGRTLKRVSTLGGAAVTLATLPSDLPSIRGATWGEDDQIVFGTNSGSGGGLFRVAAGGGEPEALTSLGEGDFSHRWPSFIEGREAVVFTIPTSASTVPTAPLAVLDLRTGEITRLGLDGTAPRYVPTGHLVYAAADGSVRAVAFDAASLEVRGTPVPLLEGVGVKLATGAAQFDVSGNGHLVYTPETVGAVAGGTAPTNLVLVALDGTRSLLAELDGTAWFPRFSPDGTRVAYGLSENENLGSDSDLWVLDLARGAQTRVTFNDNNRFYPLWTPDGTRLTHADASTPQNRLLLTPADGSGGSEVLLELGDRRFPTSWSPDGNTLAFYVGPAGTPTDSRDLWMLHRDGNTWSPAPFVETRFMERGAIFSPDGRWVAYVSNKSGQNDVYARPFPGPGVEVTISVGGGQEPVWSPSGSALYYRHERELVVVDVDGASSSLSVGTPRHVLDDPYLRDRGGATGGAANYDLAPDGERFVVVEEGARGAGAAEAPDDPSSTGNVTVEPPRLYLVLNWFEELRQRMAN